MNKLKQIVESKWFSNGIIGVIVLNAISLGAETFRLSPQEMYYLSVFNWICTGIFIIEILMKILVYHGRYFKDGWNVFDFMIVALSILPEISFLSSARVLRILRIFKVFRATRIIGHIKKLQNVIQAMLNALPSIGWTVGILAIVYYIYAVIGTNLFWEIAPEYFGNLWRTLYTLFQMTMADDLGNITRPIMQVDKAAVLYFVSFVVVAVMLILNMVVGVVIDSIEETRHQHEKEEWLKTATDLEKELDKLELQVGIVRKLLQEKKDERNKY